MFRRSGSLIVVALGWGCSASRDTDLADDPVAADSGGSGYGGGDTDADDPTPPADDPETLDPADAITITEPATGVWDCLPAAGTWLTQTVDPSCVAEVAMTGDVTDFESGDGVGDILVEIFRSDVIAGAPDGTVTSGADGTISGVTGPTCTVFATRVSRPGDPDIATAVQFHWSEPYSDPMDTFFNSVSGGTIQLISALLGITFDDQVGVVAGTAYHCEGEGKPAAHLQVLARAADGTYPAVQAPRYFVDEFPSRVAVETSEDGLFLIGSLPPGAYVIEAWAIPAAGEAPRVVGQSEIEVFAGALSISDVYAGSEDGRWLPASCTAPCP